MTDPRWKVSFHVEPSKPQTRRKRRSAKQIAFEVERQFKSIQRAEEHHSNYEDDSDLIELVRRYR